MDVTLYVRHVQDVIQSSSMNAWSECIHQATSHVFRIKESFVTPESRCNDCDETRTMTTSIGLGLKVKFRVHVTGPCPTRIRI